MMRYRERLWNFETTYGVYRLVYKDFGVAGGHYIWKGIECVSSGIHVSFSYSNSTSSSVSCTMWFAYFSICVLSVASSISASPIRPEGWFQDSSSAAAGLFKRAPANEPTTFPDGYSTPPTSMTPQSWTDRLAQVVASPSFPTFVPRASETSPWIDADGSVIQNSDERVCMFTSGCINDMDIMYAGHGNIGVSRCVDRVQYDRS